MLQTGMYALQGAVHELTLPERFISSAKVILTGFVVVFAMLLLLILIIKLYSAAIGGAQRAMDRRAKRKEHIKELVREENGVHIIKKPAYVTAPTVDDDDGDDIPEEVIAVIAAAVATYAAPGTKTRIKSIKKANGGRSAWANAGVLDNTRPF